jgi:hypothetical protein
VSLTLFWTATIALPVFATLELVSAPYNSGTRWTALAAQNMATRYAVEFGATAATTMVAVEPAMAFAPKTLVSLGSARSLIPSSHLCIPDYTSRRHGKSERRLMEAAADLISTPVMLLMEPAAA